MQIFTHNNPFKEKTLLLEKDNREKIKKTFKVSQDIADFAHRLDENLSIWIVDNLIKQLIKDRHFTRDQVITFLNTSDSDKDNYLQAFQTKVVSILDYYANPEGKADYPDFDKFKKEDFDILYNKSDVWHKGLKSTSKRTTEIVDTEHGIEILKQYEPTANGVIYYWADLHKPNSETESSRMGHCGNTTTGTTLLSLRSFTPSIDRSSYISKSHITIALNREEQYYSQCKGKQNRKPSLIYRPYLFDIFMLDEDIQDYQSEYDSSNDFTVADFSNSQIAEIQKTKPTLIESIIPSEFLDFQEEISKMSPKEVYSQYVKDINVTIKKITGKYYKTTYPKETMIPLIMNQCIPIILQDDSIFNKMCKQYVDFSNYESDDNEAIELAIIDYVIFANSFNKVKKNVEYYFNEYDKFNNKIEKPNIIMSFCKYGEAYPDYFMPYATKIVLPVIQKLVSNKIPINKIKEDYGDDTLSIIKKVIYKNKSEYQNILYHVHLDDISIFYKNGYDENTQNYLIFLNDLIKKIEEAILSLKGTPEITNLQNEIIKLGIFKDFNRMDCLYIYSKNPDLLPFSQISNYQSDIKNKKIETDFSLYNVPIYSSGRYGDRDRIDIQDVIEYNRSNSYHATDVNSYLYDLEKDKVKYKKTYDTLIKAIEEETGDTYSDILENYGVKNLDDAINELNNDNLIDETYEIIKSSIRYAEEDDIENQIGKKYKAKLIEYINDIGLELDLDNYYPAENQATISISFTQLIDLFIAEIENETDTRGNYGFFSPKKFIKSYIEQKKEEEIDSDSYSVNLDEMYSDVDSETINDYILNEL